MSLVVGWDAQLPWFLGRQPSALKIAWEAQCAEKLRAWRQFFLLLRLPPTPQLENAFPDPEKTEAVEKEAQKTEVPQEYRVAHRKSNADKYYACNNAFHKSAKIIKSNSYAVVS